MKNKAPLPLMEQLIMILVFAMAAVMCVQGFALAGRISRRQEARAQAVIPAQNTAELLKHTAGDYEAVAQTMGGTWDGQCLTIPWDDSCVLQAIPVDTDLDGLGSARIQVLDADDLLFEITVAWQEVSTDVFP